jgi:hypothetical protein
VTRRKPSIRLSARRGWDIGAVSASSQSSPERNTSTPSGIWDGRASSYKTCLRCAGVRKWYVAEALPRHECGPCFGELWQHATDHGNACTIQELTASAVESGYFQPLEPKGSAAA